jgi:V/A-type H+-transporting ATPase subunit K
MSFILVMSVLLVLSTIVVGVSSSHRNISKSQATTFLGLNVFTFFTLLIGATVFIFSGNDALASATTATVTTTSGTQEGLKFIAAALSTGLAAIGAGIAVAITGSAAIGAISEDAKLLGKTVIFVGLAEGIAIYGLIISIMILGS